MVVFYRSLKALFVFSVACLLAFASSSFLYGQNGLKKEASFGLSHALKFKGVSDDLQMTDEQTDRLLGLWSQVETRLGQQFQEYSDSFSPRFDAEKKKALKTKLTEGIEKVREFESKRINDVLLPHQIDRLKQIRFQVLRRNRNGFGGLEEELELDKKQMFQLKEIKKSATKSFRDLGRGARKQQLSRIEVREKLEELQEKLREDSLKVLSKEQKSKFDELVGEPFEFQVGAPKTKSD